MAEAVRRLSDAELSVVLRFAERYDDASAHVVAMLLDGVRHGKHAKCPRCQRPVGVSEVAVHVLVRDVAVGLYDDMLEVPAISRRVIGYLSKCLCGEEYVSTAKGTVSLDEFKAPVMRQPKTMDTKRAMTLTEMEEKELDQLFGRDDEPGFSSGRNV